MERLRQQDDELGMPLRMDGWMERLRQQDDERLEARHALADLEHAQQPERAQPEQELRDPPCVEAADRAQGPVRALGAVPRGERMKAPVAGLPPRSGSGGVEWRLLGLT